MKKTVFFLLLATTSIFVHAQPGTKYDITGRWCAYNVEGERVENLDFTVFYNEDVGAYFAKYNGLIVAVNEKGELDFEEQNANVAREGRAKLIFDSDSSFTVRKVRHFRIQNTQNRRRSYEEYCFLFTCTCSLKYVPNNNKLVGRVQFESKFEAMGNSRFEHIEEAMRAGRAYVIQDCDGNCGGMDVIYRRR